MIVNDWWLGTPIPPHNEDFKMALFDPTSVTSVHLIGKGLIHSSPVVEICLDRGNRYVKTTNGSTYYLGEVNGDWWNLFTSEVPKKEWSGVKRVV